MFEMVLRKDLQFLSKLLIFYSLHQASPERIFFNRRRRYCDALARTLRPEYTYLQVKSRWPSCTDTMIFLFQPRKQVRRCLISAALAAGCVWTAAAVYLGESSLRLPRKSLPAQTRWSIIDPESAEIVSADGLKLRGWYFRAPESNGAVVICPARPD